MFLKYYLVYDTMLMLGNNTIVLFRSTKIHEDMLGQHNFSHNILKTEVAKQEMNVVSVILIQHSLSAKRRINVQQHLNSVMVMTRTARISVGGL